MAKVKKLPSGSYMVQVYRNGVRKAFTDPDKFMVQQKAAEWLASNPVMKNSDPTFSEAAEQYIAMRSEVLSPTTVRSYKKLAANDFFPFSLKRVRDITVADDIQPYINQLARDHSAKTCCDRHGFISAVIHSVVPEIRLTTRLPKKGKPTYSLPDDQTLKKLLLFVRGSDLELPILLSAFGSLRRSEVCALQLSDFSRKNCTVHVHAAGVFGSAGWTKKSPKTVAGDRYVKVPKRVFEILPDKDPVCNFTPQRLYKRFEKALKQAGIAPFRYHDLRHYYASSQHALGVPDAYVMKSGGWETDTVLKNVYRNVLTDAEQRFYDMAIGHYDSMIASETASA